MAIPPIDFHFGTGYECAGVGSQVRHVTGNLFGFAKAAHGNLSGYLSGGLGLLFLTPSRCGKEIVLNRSGANHVDPDVPADQLCGHNLIQGFYRAFGRRVYAEVGEAQLVGNTGIENDAGSLR